MPWHKAFSRHLSFAFPKRLLGITYLTLILWIGEGCVFLDDSIPTDL